MRLCTYNILDGGVGRADPLAEVLRLARADVVIVQEAWDAAWFHRLADALGMDRFLAEHPIQKDGHACGAVGLLCSPAFEIREAMNVAALDRRLTRGCLRATVGAGRQQLTLIGLHLHARETLADEDVRLGELAAVLELGGTLREKGIRHVLVGDFNATHPDAVVDVARLRPKSRARIEGQAGNIPREAIRQILRANYVDAHAIGRTPADFDISMTTAYPTMRTDYIFVTPDLAKAVTSCETFKTPIGRFASDHYPVVAEIQP